MLPPAPGARRHPLLAAMAGVAFALFAAWGLGPGRWPLAAGLGVLVGGVLWAVIAVTDRAVRKYASLFVAGLREGGLRITRTRSRGDWFGYLTAVELETPLGTGRVMPMSSRRRSIEWQPPGRTTTRFVSLLQRDRLIGDDLRKLTFAKGAEEGRALVAGAKAGSSTTRGRGSP
jgi:hypothetical protein